MHLSFIVDILQKLIGFTLYAFLIYMKTVTVLLQSIKILSEL